MSRTIKAPTGSKLTCKNWLIEAAYRMIQNNLDAEVAFDPDNLIVYGGRGKAARNWESFDAILRSLRELNEDETLLIQSGKPVGVFKSHGCAACAACEYEHRPALGDTGAVRRVRARRADDVWPDDGGFVDLHRHARDLAGYV